MYPITYQPMIERHTSRNSTPRTTPEEPSKSCSRSKLPVPWAATGAVEKEGDHRKLGYHADRARSNVLPSRNVMRAWRLPCALARIAGAASLGGCQGNGGAVSVRWRISNLSTGQTYDPMSAAANDGSCCSDVELGGICASTSIWVVQSVSVTLRDPTTGVPTPGVAARTFPCKLREIDDRLRPARPAPSPSACRPWSSTATARRRRA